MSAILKRRRREPRGRIKAAAQQKLAQKAAAQTGRQKKRAAEAERKAQELARGSGTG